MTCNYAVQEQHQIEKAGLLSELSAKKSHEVLITNQLRSAKESYDNEQHAVAELRDEKATLMSSLESKAAQVHCLEQAKATYEVRYPFCLPDCLLST